MIWLSIIGAFIAYVVFSLWMIKRVTAWNVVLVGVAMRQVDPELEKNLQSTVIRLLMEHRLDPALFVEGSVPVRYALISLAMRELGIPSVVPGIPLRHLKKPLLADGAIKHIWVVSKSFEARYGVSLPELRQPEPPSSAAA